VPYIFPVPLYLSDKGFLSRTLHLLGYVAGNWGFTDSGAVIGVGPRTAVGIFTLDGNVEEIA
jgi:hypothetical protein